MPVTYSYTELKEMIPRLDGEEIETLRTVIHEERSGYSFEELIEIYQLIMVHILQLWKTENENKAPE